MEEERERGQKRGRRKREREREREMEGERDIECVREKMGSNVQITCTVHCMRYSCSNTNYAELLTQYDV